MVTFKKEYYENLPEEFKISVGILDIARHRRVVPTRRYKEGDRVVVLPVWDGSNCLTFEEVIELHQKGEVGEVMELTDRFYFLGEGGIPHHGGMVVKTPSTTIVCDSNWYRIGYPIKKKSLTTIQTSNGEN